MIRVTESGMTFGPFDEACFFRVEASPVVRRLQGIKTCELVYWNAHRQQLVLLEAKSSIPKPSTCPEEYRVFFTDVLEKLDNALQLLLTGILGRNPLLARELGAGIASVDWPQAKVVFYLVVPDVPDPFLPSLTEKLRQVMHRQRRIWQANAFVINRQQAINKGLAEA